MTDRRRARAVFAACAVLGLAACATPQGPGGPQESAVAEQAGGMAFDRVLDRADRALEAGGARDAMAHYQMVLGRDPGNARARLGLAEVALRGEDPEKARGMLLSLVDDPAVAPRARQGLGLAALREGDVEDAVKHLEAATAADASLWRAWNALGAAHDRREDWAAAEAAYERALAAAPDEAAVHNNRGFSLVLQGRHDDAVPHLVRAAELGRDEALPRVNLRLALAWQGRYDAAVAGADPGERARVLNNVGYVALIRGDLEAAESLFVRALESSASYFEPARLNLNHLRSLKGETA